MPIFNWRTPIPYEHRDHGTLGDYMKEYKIIPVYGTMEEPSHSFMRVIRDLVELSPTYGVVREAVKKWTFGHNVQIVGQTFPGLKGEREEVDYARQLTYAQALDRIGLSLKEILACTKKIDDHLESQGNAYLRIRQASEGEQKAYGWTVLDPLTVAYTVTDDDDEDFAIESIELDNEAIEITGDATIYRVTQQGQPLRWMEEDDGTLVALIHLKEPSTSEERRAYARTPLMRLLTALYTDHMHWNHMSKSAHAPMKARKIIAITGPDPQAQTFGLRGMETNEEKREPDAFKRDALVIKELVTGLDSKGGRLGPKSDDSEVAVVEIPFGGTKPEVIDMDINRDTKYLEYQETAAARRIAAHLGWDLTVTALRDAKAGLGGNLLYDTYVTLNMETVEPKQMQFEDFWNGLIVELLREEGAGEDDLAIGIKFTDALAELIEKMKTAAPSMMNGEEEAPDEEEEEDEEEEVLDENDAE